MTWKPSLRYTDQPIVLASSQHHAEPAASPSATARAVTAAPKPRPRKPGTVATAKIPVHDPSVTLTLVAAARQDRAPLLHDFRLRGAQNFHIAHAYGILLASPRNVARRVLGRHLLFIDVW
jgi:hypothetical protein